MANGNGHPEETRLDRIERMMEAAERRNQTAHEGFETDCKRLLTSQILMNDAMQRMISTVDKIGGKMQEFETGMARLELKMEETTDKLNALITTVDGMIKPPAGRNG